MATDAPLTVTDSWQPITTAGQSGSVWIVEFDDLAGLVGQADVIICHKTGSAPVDDEYVNRSKRLYKTNDNNTMLLTADNASDIFYARCKTSESEANIVVDVV